MEVDADRFGMDDQFPVIVMVSISDIGLNRHMRLTADIIIAFHHHVRLVKDRFSFRALGNFLDIINIGGAGMDLQGIRFHGGRGAHVGGQLFQFNLDLLGSGIGIFLGIGANNSQSVTELEHLGIAEDRAIPAVTQVRRKGNQAGNTILAFDVLGGDHFEDAGHLLGLRGINGEDVGMTNLGLNQRQLQRIFRQGQSAVGTEIPCAGDLGCSAGAGHIGAEHLAVLGDFVGQFFQGDRTVEDLGRILDCIDQLFITGTAAGVLIFLEPVTDFLTRRVGIRVEQGLGGNDKAGGAESALGAAVHHPGHLNRMKIARSTDAFDGGYGCAIGNPVHFGNAGAYQFAIHNDVAGAALPFAATDLGTGKAQGFADHVGQHFGRFGDHGPFNAIDIEFSSNHYFLSNIFL